MKLFYSTYSTSGKAEGGSWGKNWRKARWRKRTGEWGRREDVWWRGEQRKGGRNWWAERRGEQGGGGNCRRRRESNGWKRGSFANSSLV